MPLRASVTTTLLALSLGAASGLGAQQPTPRPAPQPASAAAAQPAAPAANPADVQSVDAILVALYDVISGPAGQKRDWNRFASLFYPGARLVPTGSRPDGSAVARVITPQEYVERSGPVLERDGFFEKEIARTTERYGNVVHAFSTYESRRAATDATPFMRGINSIQLFNDGTRWYVLTIFWESERPTTPIPAKYLPRE
jgi:hypothetical protein